MLGALHSHLKSKKPKRKDFAKSTIKAALERQGFRCNICEEKTDVWEIDHFNGKSSDNRLENCQPLCPECHARKTRKIKPKKRKLFIIIKPKKLLPKKLKKKLYF